MQCIYLYLWMGKYYGMHCICEYLLSFIDVIFYSVWTFDANSINEGFLAERFFFFVQIHPIEHCIHIDNTDSSNDCTQYFIQLNTIWNTKQNMLNIAYRKITLFFFRNDKLETTGKIFTNTFFYAPTSCGLGARVIVMTFWHMVFWSVLRHLISFSIAITWILHEWDVCWSWLRRGKDMQAWLMKWHFDGLRQISMLFIVVFDGVLCRRRTNWNFVFANRSSCWK